MNNKPDSITAGTGAALAGSLTRFLRQPATRAALLAFALMPLMMFLIIAIGGLTMVPRPVTRGSLLGVVIAAMLFGTAFGFAGIVCGVPAYLVARHFGLVRWWTAAAAGWLAGTGYAVLQMRPLLINALYSGPGVVGAAVGVMFWAMWWVARRYFSKRQLVDGAIVGGG
jgi:hypothetical protein